jgi:hypothetical protein
MRRADPQELREDARPALLLSLSEKRLSELFPVPFSSMESEPEPSKGALVQLASGNYIVVAYGAVTRRATVSFPVSVDVHDAIEALLREVALQPSEVLWTVEAPRHAGAR